MKPIITSHVNYCASVGDTCWLIWNNVTSQMDQSLQLKNRASGRKYELFSPLRSWNSISGGLIFPEAEQLTACIEYFYIMKRV